jgi:hypothetical protein
MTPAEQVKKGCKTSNVFEVTIKRVYIVSEHSHVDEKFMEDEWFGTHMQQFHAHRDACHIGGADTLVDIKEMT